MEMNYVVVGSAQLFFPGMTKEVFIARMGEMGFVITKFNENPRQRVEFQGQPMFKGLVGPMWDGGTIRYETAAVYAECSR